MRFPFLTDDEIVWKAEQLLTAAFGRLEDVPSSVDLDVIVFDCLYEADGLVFSDEEDLGQTADGDEVLGVTYPRIGHIKITNRLRGEAQLRGRYRFTVAHELGHWVLHRPLFLQKNANLELFGRPDAPAGLVGLSRNVDPGAARVPPEEWQANRFAAVLLVNPTRLRLAFADRFPDPPVTPATFSAGLKDPREVARAVARAEVGGKPCLAKMFDVSIEAMAVALQARGYVSGTARLL